MSKKKREKEKKREKNKKDLLNECIPLKCPFEINVNTLVGCPAVMFIKPSLPF